MNTVEFLRAIWPDNGIYCLAIPREKGWQHLKFDKIEEAAAVANRRAQGSDVYFAMHSMRARQVPHSEPALAAQGRMQTRVRRNMLECRCFFFDLDVGEGEHKYASREEAMLGLKDFIVKSELPWPMVVSSGKGFHVYWRLTDAIPSEEWRQPATQLRQLAFHYGLKPDRTRTTDTASVLRVAGTFHRKDPNNILTVDVMKQGAVTPTGVFLKLLADALIRQGLDPQQATKLAPVDTTGLGSNLKLEYDGPNPKIISLLTACPQMARIAQMNGKFSEPEWYSLAIGVTRFTENAQRNIHKLSKGHPDYTEAACNAKIKQSEANQSGPTTCTTIEDKAGDSPCLGCRFQGKVMTPIQAALLIESAPPPAVVEVVAGTIVTTTLPDAPFPFKRLKDGSGIAIEAKNADGNVEIAKIYDYDLYPIRRLSNRQAGTEQQQWHVGLPRGEAKDFTLDAEMLYDPRKFTVAVANQGIYAAKGHISHLQEYMVAYIAELQKLTDADPQANHLGWTEDYAAFIMPDRMLLADGTVKAAQLSAGALRSSADIGTKGTLQEQCRLLSFYNHPDYIPNQFMILAGIAAPIFYMTGHHGVIVNASGEAGSSKSTTLYASASPWGHPSLYPINGTNNGATVRGRNERVTVLANYPVCVDEITHMPNKDMVDLAMSITQPGHRIRLQNDGVERASTGGYKATMMLATANVSLHSVLATDNAAGTAGSMRVFEIIFRANGRHQKHEADDFLFALKENYGHIGPVFVAEVMKRREWVANRVREVMRDIDTTCRITGAERFWSAPAAVVLVAAEICMELGLLGFEPAALRRWIIEVQIPFMRGVVKVEYSEPMGIVSEFLETINGQILVMNKNAGGNLGNLVRSPKYGALLAHYDTGEQVVYILKKAFKDYCNKSGANATKIIDELHQPQPDGSRICTQPHTRRVLGAGTELAKAQTWCFAIKMDHPSVTGAVDLKVITGGKDAHAGEAAL